MLNYLRHGKLVLSELDEEGVLEEAEFYNVTHLIGLLKDSIARREQRPAADKKRVYRVLQCQENELTQVRKDAAVLRVHIDLTCLCLFRWFLRCPMDGASSN